MPLRPGKQPGGGAALAGAHREARTLSALPVRETALLLQQQWGTWPASLPLEWEPLDPIPHLLATLTGKASWRAASVDMVLVPELRPEQAARRTELCTWLDQQ